jgi:transcriptional regulator with XRE-family HTH domain
MANTVDGQRIRALRESRGIRQTRLAQDTGITAFYLRSIELHGQQPSGIVLHALARALHVTPAELMSGAAPKRKVKP